MVQVTEPHDAHDYSIQRIGGWYSEEKDMVAALVVFIFNGRSFGVAVFTPVCIGGPVSYSEDVSRYRDRKTLQGFGNSPDEAFSLARARAASLSRGCCPWNSETPAASTSGTSTTR